MRSPLSAALMWTVLAVLGHAQNAGSLHELEVTLTFESAHSGTLPGGWSGGRPGTVSVDGAVVDGGRWSARLERTATSPEAFSTLTKAIPVDFAGKTIEWLGFLRSEAVSDAGQGLGFPQVSPPCRHDRHTSLGLRPLPGAAGGPRRTRSRRGLHRVARLDRSPGASAPCDPCLTLRDDNLHLQPDLEQPGAFRWGDPVSISSQPPHYAGKVVILVDESSQRQAEYTAMAFRANPRAIVVGSTTAGADGNVSQVPLPSGLSSMFSGIGVFYPDKAPTQRVGIVADVEVRPTIAGIRTGRDEVLEEALRQILGREAQQNRSRAWPSRVLDPDRLDDSITDWPSFSPGCRVTTVS